MLPKNRRIDRKYFHNLIKGRRYNSKHLLLYVFDQNTTKTPSTFAFSAPKKVLSTAVLRNKYRRRGYSVIKKNISRIKENKQLMFVYKTGSRDLSFSNLEVEIKELLSDSGVLS